ncbi:hypothetical protein DEA8626_02066 [Defluviimonas aquaemixtae]|uniref:Acetolactate synthase n=1 Tax=Albidovulum aquaemixtae TaxID=1542388 RepID=A0A2R8B7D0_9RHOB|nr:DUF6497 family protein [Defluviimonas aquaemixtae]SPH18527.1 hypothetical protein DEA8626_02066 [Defluviimonas aquaemixtae]
MIRWALAIAGVIGIVLWLVLGKQEAAVPVAIADIITVPSGQAVSFVDTVNDAPGPQGLTIRFRFLAPGIARERSTVSAEAAQEDMAHLCEIYALPRLPGTGPRPEQIVISFMDRVVPFGEPDPEATQFFEAYRVEDGTCIWEAL